MASGPAFSRPLLGSSLALALLVHALGLGVAAVVGFSIAPEEDSRSETFALRLAPRRPTPPPPEAAFAPAVAETEPAVSDGFLLAEPELIPSEVWESAAVPETRSETLLAQAEPPAVPLDLTPPDLMDLAIQLDPGGAARKLPHFFVRGAESTEAGPASGGGVLGGTGAASASMGATGGAGPGRGSDGNGAAAGTSSSAPRAHRVREAAPLEVPPPAYPLVSRRAGEEGSVLCRLHLSAAGLVTEVDVVESSGFPRLDEAARQALKSWRFDPRLVDERAVASTLLHRVKFQLEG